MDVSNYSSTFLANDARVPGWCSYMAATGWPLPASVTVGMSDCTAAGQNRLQLTDSAVRVMQQSCLTVGCPLPAAVNKYYRWIYGQNWRTQ